MYFVIRQIIRIEGKHNNIVQSWEPFFNLYPGYRNIFENIVTRGSTVIMQGYSICSDDILNNIRVIYCKPHCKEIRKVAW